MSIVLNQMTSRIDGKQQQTDIPHDVFCLFFSINWGGISMGSRDMCVSAKNDKYKKKEEEIEYDLLETARFNWIGRC